jgi:plasmid maintenance system antidote protein VapI
VRQNKAIKEMIRGKEIVTPEAVYRLKLKGGEQPEMPPP